MHLTTNINDGWHIYSQATPDGGPVATTVLFNNPLLSVKGKTKEKGNLKTKNEPLFGVDVKQYEHQVDFVQAIQLKAPVKTNVTGTIEFMACNNMQCLLRLNNLSQSFFNNIYQSHAEEFFYTYLLRKAGR